MLGKIKGKRRRGWQENEMVRWHHQLKGHESEQTPGDGEGQESLVCFSPRGSQKVRHDWVTEQQQKHYISLRCTT